MQNYGIKSIYVGDREKEKLTTLIKEAKERGIEFRQEGSDFDLVISDDEEVMKEAKRRKNVTVWPIKTLKDCEGKEASLFVLDLECLDMETLFQAYCHEKGVAYEIGKNEKISVRELTIKDVDAYVEITREEHIRSFLPDGKLAIEEQKEKLVAYIKNVYSFYGFGIYGIFLREEDELIGAVSLDLKETTGVPQYEVGFFIRHYYLGSGYGIMGLEFLLDYSFLFLQLESLVSITASSNLHAINLLKKAGFQSKEEGECLIFTLSKGTYEKTKESRTGE